MLRLAGIQAAQNIITAQTRIVPGHGPLGNRAALELGFDRIKLRRKNLISPKAMPYRNAVGMLYDSGTYQANMETAMALADWKGFEKRRREAKRRGKGGFVIHASDTGLAALVPKANAPTLAC